jgi:hypothetical protein
VRDPFACQIPGGLPREVDAPVFISANGGYRSPAHQIGGAKSSSCVVGQAANIYRIGDTFLRPTRRSIEKYRTIAASLSPAFLFGHSDVKKDRPATTSTSI